MVNMNTVIKKNLSQLLKSIRNSLLADQKFVLPDNLNVNFNSKISQVFITLFQEKNIPIRWGSKKETLEKTIQQIIFRLRSNPIFNSFDLKDNNKCRIMFEIVTKEYPCNIQNLNTVRMYSPNRFEPGVNGLKYRYKNRTRFFMPTDGYTKSIMGINQLLNYLSKQCGIAKQTNKISQRALLMRKEPIEYTFIESNAYISYKDDIVELFRGLPKKIEFNKNILYDKTIKSIDWIVDNMNDDGSFLYFYDPYKNSIIDDMHPKMVDPLYNNILRHSGGTIALLRGYEISKNKIYLQKAKESIGFLLSTFKTHQYKKQFACYPFFNKKSKLGGAGIGLVALMHFYIHTNSEQYRKQIDGLIRHILSRIDKNGEMIGYYIHPKFNNGHALINPNDDVKKELFSFYYPGEALLGLALYYLHINNIDEDLKKDIIIKSEKALDFLVDIRPVKYKHLFKSLPSDAWLMQAIEEWVKVDGFKKQSYIDFVFNDTNAMFEHMYTHNNITDNTADYVGGFYYNYGDHVYHDASRNEGVISAYYLAKYLNDNEKVKWIEKNLILSIKGLMKTFYDDLSTYPHIEPKKALHSFRFKLTRQWIRIDSAQHAVSLFARLYMSDIDIQKNKPDINNIKISLQPLDLANITKGHWENLDDSVVITGINYLSKSVKKGDLFITFTPQQWRERKYSNENEIEVAFKKGAVAAIIRDDSKITSDKPLLRVKDTKEAFKNISLQASNITKAKKVLVTGSFGKTGFKFHLNHIVKDQIKTHTVLNTANQSAGIFKTLSTIKPNDELVIVEVAVPYDIGAYRASLVNPDICVITSIGHEHIEQHKTIENLVKRKVSVVSALKTNGKVIVPRDDEHYHLIKKELQKYNDINILTFGSGSSCNAQILNHYFDDFAWNVIARIENDIVEYKVPFIGAYAPVASLAELLCAKHLNLDIYKCASKYINCTNYKSSGTFYDLNYKDKNFYLYDQSRRGGIEGYKSFFKTIKNLNPKNGAKKIVITSEFVDIPDGETKYIDKKLFQNLITDADIDQIYTVENFKVHDDVIIDKSKRIQHYNNIKDIQKSFFNIVNNGDIVCIKSIFESSLPKLPNNILKNSTIIEESKKNISNIDIFKNMHLISSGDIEKFKQYINKANKKSWIYYFPFLHSFSNSKSRKILFKYENNSLVIFLLRHLNKSRKPFLQLYCPPLPFNKDLLMQSLLLIKEFNNSGTSTILWCDADDIKNIRKYDIFNDIIKFKHKESEFIFQPSKYNDLSGGHFRNIRQQISGINKLDNVKVLPYENKYYQDCIKIYDFWKTTQKNKYDLISDETYTKMSLLEFGKFSKKDLDGIVITINNEVKAFAFYGSISNDMGNMFIGKSDHKIRGLQAFLKYQVLLNMQNFKLANDSDGISCDLYESKKKFRPVLMHKIYKARCDLDKKHSNKKQRFSRSKLWELQKDYYKSLVVSDAWGKDIIPFFNTSNNFIANKYAQIIKNILDNTTETLYILELGSGHGRFSYLLQKALNDIYKNQPKPYKYIMTDISQKNIDTWKKHPLMQQFIKEDILDFALFDISSVDDNILEFKNKPLSSVIKEKNLLVISNFVTSALAFDIFNIQKNKIYECSAQYDKNIETLSPQKFHNAMKKTNISFKTNEIKTPYYKNKYLNEILEYYRSIYNCATIDIPIDIIQTIEYFSNLSSELSFLLSDEANLSLKFFNDRKPKVFKLKSGSFSNRINLDAFDRFAQKQDLNLISPLKPNASFDTYLFLPKRLQEKNEFKQIIESFSANDFSIAYNNTKSDKTITNNKVLSLFKVSNFDSNIINDFYETLLKISLTKDQHTRKMIIYSLIRSWNNYYSITESFEMSYMTGRLFYRLKDHKNALGCFSYSLSKDNSKYQTWYYLGLCHQSLQKYNEAIKHYQKAIEVKGVYPQAKERIIECQKKIISPITYIINNKDHFEQLAERNDVLGFKDLYVCKFIIIDIDTKTPKLFFMDTKKYEHHYEYYKEVLNIDISEKEFDKITYYTNEGRKNLSGSIVAHNNFSNNQFPNGLYTLEFWPSDPITFKHLTLTWSMINNAMTFAKDMFVYHLSSQMQIKIYKKEIDLYEKAAIPVMNTDTLFNNLEYIPLNLKNSYGILKILDKDEIPSIQDIVILKYLPNDLSHVRGIISDVPQTPLSHVNLKAKQNKIPNAYIKNASLKKEFLDLNGKPVYLQITADGYKIEEVSLDTVMDKLDKIMPKNITYPAANLSYKNIMNLEDIGDKNDGFGTKASNMGILYQTLDHPFHIKGMAIPFYFYDTFMKYNQLNEKLDLLIQDKSIYSNIEYKHKKLLEFRKLIKNAMIPEWMSKEINIMQNSFPKGSDIRLRSSSNNEDMPEFNGAGLYSSELYIYGKSIENCIKKVWASLWSYQAFEERTFHKISHNDVSMAILVHQDIYNEKFNGVAVTKNLFDKYYEGIYINVQHGQSLVTNPDIEVLSDELIVAGTGPNKKYEIQYIRHTNLNESKNGVMTESEIMLLLEQSQIIHKVFKKLLNKESQKDFAMELEFLMSNDGKLKILQARPWIDH